MVNMDFLFSASISAALFALVGVGGYFMSRVLKQPHRLESGYVVHDAQRSELDRAFSEVKLAVASLRKEVADFELDDDARQTITSGLRAELERRVAGQFLEDLREKVESAAPTKEALELLADTHHRTIVRLDRYITGQINRNGINLLMGVLVSCAALGVLAQYVFSYGSLHGSVSDIAVSSIPRLSLAVFIEVFAFFFLRLYRVGLSDIKSVYNELTSVESRFAAVAASVALSDNESIRNNLDVLVRTERNFVLEKGQTTVDLELSKIEIRQESVLVKRLLDLLGKK